MIAVALGELVISAMVGWSVGAAVTWPGPLSIGVAVATGCIFIVSLVFLAKAEL